MTGDDFYVDMPMNIEDEFGDLTADLLSATKYEPVLRELFGMNAGQWLEAASLFGKFDELAKPLGALEESAGGPLLLTWMEYSASAYGDGYCTVVFFVESIYWSSVAIYNRGRLLSNAKVHSTKTSSIHS